MSQWINKIENHPIHSNLKDLSKYLSQINDRSNADIEHIEGLERLKEICRVLTGRLDNLNPNLVVIETLDAINIAINHQNEQLQSYLNNGGNFTNLVLANKNADIILNQLCNLPLPSIPSDIEGLRNAVASFRKATGQYIRNLEEEFNALKQKYDDVASGFKALSSEIGTQKGRLDTAIAEFQSQFSQAENNRRDQFNQAETTRAEQYSETRRNIDEALNGLQKESSKNEETRSSQFLEATESRKAKFTEEIETFQEAFKRFIFEITDRNKTFENHHTEEVKLYLEQLEGLKKRAEDIVHVISNTGMVGGYQRVANEERALARRWEWIALGAMTGLIGFAIWAFWAATHNSFSWGLFSSRLFAAATFGILAAYAARQADNHQETERKNRRLELELASIDPYILPLPEEERNQVKRQLAERLFGQNEPVHRSKATETSGTAIDLVKVALEAVKTALEQVGKK